MKRHLIVAATILLMGQTVLAGLVVSAGGTGAPPATLGGYAMTPFGPDGRAEGAVVPSVPSPLGGDVVFDVSLEHMIAGSVWDTWSHGYSGDVYYCDGPQVVLACRREPGPSICMPSRISRANS